ncbi:hypothetical protein P4B35_20770 [Pontiellaceae bacterium B12227]|nr:hypothetical protein [Pontiellaceae bacterium B12227]
MENKTPIRELVIKFLQQRLLMLWWFLLSGIFLSLIAKFGDAIFDRLLSAMGKKWLLSLIMLSLLTLIILLIDAFKNRETKSAQYRLKPVAGKGYSIDPKTGEVACPKCSTPENPVFMSDQGHALYCYACGCAVKK